DEAACKKQRASLYVYGKDTVGGAYSDDPVAFRQLQGKFNSGSGLCEPTVVDFKTPDPDVPQNTVALFMRPTHFPGGLLIATMPARNCTAVPLNVEVSEQF